MTGAELAAEWLHALMATSLADRRPLIEAKVTNRALGMIAAARVTVRGDTYEPNPDGGAAFLLSVRTHDPVTSEALNPDDALYDGEVIDIVAFHPKHPARWALRYGAAVWLGCCEPQYLDPPPVAVLRSPVSWLQSDCRGLVMLSRDRRDQYRLLSNLRKIEAEDDDHRAELLAVLQRPWATPPVTVAKRDRRRA